MRKIEQVVFSPDGAMLAALGSRAAGPGRVGVVEWWDVRSRAPRATAEVTPVGEWLGPPVFAHGGAALAAVDAGGLRVWDGATGREKFALPGVKAAAFLHDARRLAVAEGGSVFLYDPASGARAELLTRPTGVRSLVLSPGGRWLAVSCEGGETTLCDLAGKEASLTIPSTGRPAFAPDGRTVATLENRTVTLRQLATGQELLTLECPSPRLVSVAFFGDGKALIGLAKYTAGGSPHLVIWPAAPEVIPPD